MFQMLTKYFKAKPPVPNYKKSYEFTTDWFSGGIKLWRNQLGIFKDQPAVKALEIGSYEGRSAIWLLENILTSESAKLVCIDGYPTFKLKRAEKVFRSNLALSGFSSKVDLIISKSEEALPKLKGSSFDFIYIDGGHEGEEITADAESCWELLKIGGILIFDDYKLQPEYYRGQSPESAIDAFLEKYKNQLVILHKDYQVFIQKK